MLVDSFFQLNLVALQIKGATISLLFMLADDVLFRMVGAIYINAVSTAVLV